jgi:hypothetical protein
VLALRNSLFSLLQTPLDSHKLISDTLCKTLAFIALKACNTFWPSSPSEIAAFGCQNAATCHAAVSILKHMALIFDQTMFDKRTEAVIRGFLRGALKEVLEFLAKILGSPESVSDITFFEALSAGGHWCDFAS